MVMTGSREIVRRVYPKEIDRRWYFNRRRGTTRVLPERDDTEVPWSTARTRQGGFLPDASLGLRDDRVY